MNAVEIEEAISDLADQPFDVTEFPYRFLEAFGNKSTTIQRLRKGDSNKTDLQGALLQTNNIHILTLLPNQEGSDVRYSIRALQNSPATKKYKAKLY